MTVNPLTATAQEIRASLLAGEMTCVELVEFFLKRIEAYDRKGPSLKAIIAVCEDVYERAKALDQKRTEGKTLGSLFGLPVILKDNIEYVGAPTTAGSKSLEGYRSKGNAFLVQKLLDADAIILSLIHI